MARKFNNKVIQRLHEGSGRGTMIDLVTEFARKDVSLSEQAVRNWFSDSNGSVPGLMHFLTLLQITCPEGDPRLEAANLLLEEFFVEVPVA